MKTYRIPIYKKQPRICQKYCKYWYILKSSFVWIFGRTSRIGTKDDKNLPSIYFVEMTDFSIDRVISSLKFCWSVMAMHSNIMELKKLKSVNFVLRIKGLHLVPFNSSRCLICYHFFESRGRILWGPIIKKSRRNLGLQPPDVNSAGSGRIQRNFNFQKN